MKSNMKLNLRTVLQPKQIREFRLLNIAMIKTNSLAPEGAEKADLYESAL
jgi:hypothetical protein